MQENLRERCIYEEIGGQFNDLYEHLFFNYLYNFKTECVDQKGTLNEKCAHRVLWELDINVPAIENCMDKSFRTQTGQDNNKLLDRDRLNANELGVHTVPAVAINNNRYWGNIDGDSIFRAICSSYKLNMMPSVCTDQYEIAENIGNVQEDFVQPFTFKHVHLIGLVVLVFVFNLILLICCVRKKNKQES